MTATASRPTVPCPDWDGLTFDQRVDADPCRCWVAGNSGHGMASAYQHPGEWLDGAQARGEEARDI